MMMHSVPPPNVPPLPDVVPQPEPRPQPPGQPPEIIEPPAPDQHQPIGDPIEPGDKPGVGIVRQCFGRTADRQRLRRLLS